jgi:hypothetical protein
LAQLYQIDADIEIGTKKGEGYEGYSQIVFKGQGYYCSSVIYYDDCVFYRQGTY